MSSSEERAHSTSSDYAERYKENSSSSESADSAKYRNDRVTVKKKTKSRSRNKIPDELYDHASDGKFHRSRSKTPTKSHKIYSGESMDLSSYDREAAREKRRRSHSKKIYCHDTDTRHSRSKSRRSRSKTRRSRKRSRRYRSRSRRSRSRSSRSISLSRTHNKTRNSGSDSIDSTTDSHRSKARVQGELSGQASKRIEVINSSQLVLDQSTTDSYISKDIEENETPLPNNKMWSVETSASKMYKLVNVGKDMTGKQFMEKIAKLFKLKLGYFFVTYCLPQDKGMQIELDGDDDEGFSSAYHLLPNFSKIKVELKTCTSRGLSIQSGNRPIRNKEVVSEEIKREMGLHDDEGKRKRGCMDAKWTGKCTEIMESDARFLLEFDKVQNGLCKAWGSKEYLINPFQVICPLCGEIRVISKMNQPQEIIAHIKDVHGSKMPLATSVAVKRLLSWKENNFVTEHELDNVAELSPELFKDPIAIMEKPLVRASVLARGIVEGAV